MNYDFFVTSKQLHAIFSLLFVNINDVVAFDFVRFAKSLHANERLNRMIFVRAMQ